MTAGAVEALRIGEDGFKVRHCLFNLFKSACVNCCHQYGPMLCPYGPLALGRVRQSGSSVEGPSGSEKLVLPRNNSRHISVIPVVSSRWLRLLDGLLALAQSLTKSSHSFSNFRSAVSSSIRVFA